MNEGLPDGFSIQGVPRQLWFVLAEEPRPSPDVVLSQACFDNTVVHVFDANGQDVTSDEVADHFVIDLRFVPTEDGTGLLLDAELVPTQEPLRSCP